MMEYVHYSVMPNEVLASLIPPQEGAATMVDCTCGEGGHTHRFLAAYPNLRVIALDRDPGILEKAKVRMEEYASRFTPLNIAFDEFFKTAEEEQYDLILFDLGISSYHYEERTRLLLPQGRPRTCARHNRSHQCDGRGQRCRRAARRRDLPLRRELQPAHRPGDRHRAPPLKINDTERLAQIIYKAVPPAYRYGYLHPATRTFQAIRIEVNGELDRIEVALAGAVRSLKKGGRIAVISFHSLEDRIVKWFFKDLEGDQVNILTKKPLVPSEEERNENPPSRSAKLRVIEKL